MKKKSLIFVSVLLLFVLTMPILAAQENSAKDEIQMQLSLDRAVQLAQENNKELKIAKQRIEVAKAVLEQAQGAYWPMIDYAVSYEQANKKMYQFYPDFMTGVLYDEQFLYGVNLKLPLYTGGVINNTNKLAELQLEVAEEEARKVEQKLVCEVKQSFYQTWLADKVREIQADSYHNLEIHAERVKGFYEVGSTSKFNMLQAEVQRDAAKPAVLESQNQFDLAKTDLATKIGIDVEEDFVLDFDPEKVELPDEIKLTLQEILKEAYANRPEIHQLEKAYKASEYQRKLALADFKPSMALIASYNAKNTELSVEDVRDAWSGRLVLSGKIFDRKTYAKAKEKAVEIEVSDTQIQNVKDLIRLEAQQALDTLKNSLEKIASTKVTMEFAKEVLDMTNARYEADMGTTMDIVDAQLVVDKTTIGYYQGLIAYLSAQAKLEEVQGR